VFWQVFLVKNTDQRKSLFIKMLIPNRSFH